MVGRVPVIIFGPALFPGEGLVVDAIVFAAGLALAVATYYAVERPLHKMPLWSDDSSVTAWRTWRVNYAHSAKAAGVAVLAMLTAVVTGLAFGPMSGQVAAPPGPPRSIQLDTDAAEPDSVGHRELTARISESIEATEWPEDIESEMDLAGGLPDDVKQCAAPSPYVEEGCAWGDGERVAYVVGDSVANAYVPMYRTVLGPEWQVRQLTLNGCEFSSANLSSAGSAAVCERRVSSAISTIAASDPDVVFVTSQWTGHTKAGGKEKVGVDEWWTGARDALEQITAPTIYVAPPPGGVSVDACYSSTTAPATCASTISETWAASHAHLTRYAKSSDQLDLVDTSTWFCVEGVCPAFVGSTLTRSDHVHPTQAYLDDVAVVAKEDIRALLPEG